MLQLNCNGYFLSFYYNGFFKKVVCKPIALFRMFLNYFKSNMSKNFFINFVRTILYVTNIRTYSEYKIFK